MYDLNFFSLLKKQKQKNRSVRIIGFSLVALFVLANVALVIVGLMTTRKVETQISNNKEYINSPVTKAKVRDAEILNRENTIAANYLSLIKEVGDQFEQSNQIRVELMDHIRLLAPSETRFVNAHYSGLMVDIDCETTEQTDPLHFYHQLLKDDRFASVHMPQISFQSEGVYTYTIGVVLKGGELK